MREKSKNARVPPFQQGGFHSYVLRIEKKKKAFSHRGGKCQRHKLGEIIRIIGLWKKIKTHFERLGRSY
jgi:hypothetical protein